MAQAIAESVFDACYLIFVITVGLIMALKSNGNRLVKLFGWMAVLLGSGDAFHLVPRAIALWTTGLEANAAALGIGKLVTSVTMTVFYLILYYIWRERYKAERKRVLTSVMWLLTAARIALCALPGNRWLEYRQPVEFGILRNIPFALMGLILIVLFAVEASQAEDKPFRFLWLAVALSFAFYLPVVLFADRFPAIGMLMIPKTLAYVWVVLMGWRLHRADRKAEKTS